MTIKSHLKLRRQMMDNYIHKMIRVHPDTFRATVNTAVIICERNEYDKEDGEIIRRFDENHICQMVDMTNISIHEQYDRFIELIHKTEGVRFGDDNGRRKNMSTPEYAIYYYPQSLININSNRPFFVASPKLFKLVNDGNDKDRKPETKKIRMDGQDVTARKIQFNGDEIEVVNLGDFADVKHGLTTGDNYTYIFRNENGRGGYTMVDESLVVDPKNYHLLTDDEKKYGFNEDKFNGKYLLKYDKGGASSSEDGWLPNYNIKTNYFIDWRRESVEEMKELKGHRHDNPQYYFDTGITYSSRGVYSPTFRLNNPGPFDKESSCIFLSEDLIKPVIGILNSRLIRFLFRNMIIHTVSAEVDTIKEIPIKMDGAALDEILKKVQQIVNKQENAQEYDYASNEQLEINKIVYEAFGLEPEDIQEVENWYERRYGKLVAAQKENLRKLGKSDDYLELYKEIELEEA